MKNPRIGKIVIYTPTASEAESLAHYTKQFGREAVVCVARKELTAIVVGVNSDGTVNLQVFVDARMNPLVPTYQYWQNLVWKRNVPRGEGKGCWKASEVG